LALQSAKSGLAVRPGWNSCEFPPWRWFGRSRRMSEILGSRWVVHRQFLPIRATAAGFKASHCTTVAMPVAVLRPGYSRSQWSPRNSLQSGAP
jgi:hypothetical protein